MSNFLLTFADVKQKQTRDMKTYYQPIVNGNETPSEIYSFEVFKSAEDVEIFMFRNGYEKNEYEIKEYDEGDIEDPSIVEII